MFKSAVLIGLLSQHGADRTIESVQSLGLLQVKTHAMDMVPILTASTLNQNSAVVPLCFCLHKRLAAETKVGDSRHRWGCRVIRQHDYWSGHRIRTKSKDMATKRLPLVPKFNLQTLNLAEIGLDLSNIRFRDGLVVQEPVDSLLEPRREVKDLAQKRNLRGIEPEALSLVKASCQFVQSGSRPVASDDQAQVADRADVVGLQTSLTLGDAHTCSMVPLVAIIAFHHHSRLRVPTQTIDWFLAVGIHGLGLGIKESLGR